MKRFVLFLFLSLCLIVSLLAQNTNKKTNLPKENSKVTREYDEKGNLIRFDSVYSYSYSSDSTLMKDFSSKNFPDVFGGDFSFFNDSTFKGNSFFEEFDRMFADPFNPFDAKQDSIFSKYFEENKHFQHFSNKDSTAFSFGNFGDLFNHFFENKNDSVSIKRQGKIAQKSHPQSMEEMMQLFQEQFQEMEKQQKQFFEDRKKFNKN